VIANHFKSKGSCPATGPDIDLGDGQSCWNAQRTAQANELASWVTSTVIPGAGDPDVSIVGDLNSYAGEDPIAALESAGYTNLVKAFHGDEAYSYVFDGQWGYLDYVMASSSLVPQVTGAADAHHNADEPSVLDYNTDFKTPGQVASLYAPDRFRTSDHDPVVAGLARETWPRSPGRLREAGRCYSYAFTLGGTPPVEAVSPAALRRAFRSPVARSRARRPPRVVHLHDPGQHHDFTNLPRVGTRGVGRRARGAPRLESGHVHDRRPGAVHSDRLRRTHRWDGPVQGRRSGIGWSGRGGQRHRH
jgi:hypothetical protein